MPFVGISELIAVAKLAWTIQSLGSSKYTNAQQEFTEFIGNVSNLAETLNAIQTAVTSPVAGHQPLELRSEFVQSIISEAKETLNSCKRLIDNNASFKKDRGGYVTNILWHLTIAQYVEKLQMHIQLCVQKANLVLQFQALGSIRRNQELAQEDARANHEETLQLLYELLGRGNTLNAEHDATALLTVRINDRFEHSLSRNVSDPQPTVAQRVDAVWTFYDRSTHSFQPQEPMVLKPSPLQYLNLLKCIWLLHEIQGDRAFVAYHNRPFCAAWIRSLVRKVKLEALRFLRGTDGMQPVSEAELLRLNETDFDIDPWQTQADPNPSPFEANGGEEMLMRSTLRSKDDRTVDELLVFRIAESRLRLTRATSTRGIPTLIHSNELDCRKAYFNPIYALGAGTVHSVTWKATSSDQGGQELTFASKNDAFKFQQHVTNFRVVCDESELVSVRKKSGIFDGDGKIIGETGHVQLWAHHDPTSHKTRHTGSRHNSLSNDSSQSNSSSNTWPPSALYNARPSSTIRSSEGGVMLTDPVNPQLVLLTEEAGVKRLLSIPIDEHTRTAPDKCHCSGKNSQCQEIVIERRKDRLKVRQFRTNANSDGWNIAVLGHPVHADMAKVDEEHVKYVSIHLNSLACRQRLEENLNIACRMIYNKVNKYNLYLRNTRNTAVVQYG